MKKTCFLTPLFLILIFSCLCPLALTVNSVDYTIYNDGSFWLSYDYINTLVSNNTDFETTFNETRTLMTSPYTTLKMLGEAVVYHTLNITNAGHFILGHLTLNASVPLIHVLNVTHYYDQSLYVDRIDVDPTVTLSNNTAVVHLENCARWDIDIGHLVNNAEYSGIGLYLDAETVSYRNDITIKYLRLFDTGIMLYSASWAHDNIVHDTLISHCRVGVNITALTGSFGANLNKFINVPIDVGGIAYFLKGDIQGTLIQSSAVYDWFFASNPFYGVNGSDLRSYVADSSVKNTILFHTAFQIEKHPTLLDDNGENTLWIGEMDTYTNAFYFEGLPTPDPTPIAETTDTHTELIEFVIILSIVGLLLGAVGLRRYY